MTPRPTPVRDAAWCAALVAGLALGMLWDRCRGRRAAWLVAVGRGGRA